MKAVGYKIPLPISDDNALIDIEVSKPSVSGRDLLVEVKAVSVNPVDVKVRATGRPEVRYVASLNGTEQHYPALVELLSPQGKIGVIDDPKTLDSKPLKRKAAALCWESMFTRSLFETADMIEQHNILNEIADLLDKRVLGTTSAHNFGPINATNLKKAYSLIESGRSHGKIVLTGF